ncbi:MAG: hypothetical protein HY240_09830, partial [Actinobacteria bacterium]|nr:hypothetical protein [Actinomycetota bacterium]
MVAAALVALLAISGVVVATSGAPPQRGIPLTSQGDGEFKFLNTLGDGTPFRWNPCEPIHYVANLSEAPPGALQDLQEAVARVSDVTGIAFVYDGETTDTVEHQYGRAFQAALPGQRWLPVLITWLGQKEFRFYVPDKAVLAFAYPRPGDGTLFDQYVSGVLVVDAGADLSQGFDSRY